VLLERGPRVTPADRGVTVDVAVALRQLLPQVATRLKVRRPIWADRYAQLSSPWSGQREFERVRLLSEIVDPRLLDGLAVHPKRDLAAPLAAGH